MAKLGAVQEQTMEEILASIRRMISEGDAAISETQAAEPRIAEPSRPAANVARLFEDEGDEPEVEAAAEVEGEMEDDTGAEDQVTDNVVALAIAQAMDDAEAELRADAAAAAMQPSEEEPSSPPAAAAPPASTPTAPPAPAPGSAGQVSAAATPTPSAATARKPPAEDARTAQPTDRRSALLSPRSDAMVSGAFNQLATTMLLSGSARTVDDLVEDLLRPMLRNWLDINLPPLVERLVREEIERVARGRR